jgi:hypothetical protein
MNHVFFLIHGTISPSQQGGYKLKIPMLLLKEKEKTRQHFTQVRTALHIETDTLDFFNNLLSF